MKTIQIVLFTFLVVGYYSYFANSIPQIESHPPKKISLDAPLTEDEMIEAGEKIYSGKGTCGICHAIGRKGSRGPDLAGVGKRANSTVEGTGGKAYLLDSLLNPAAYFVEGYGPMMPPMADILTPGEVMVTVAFLQSMGGNVDITPDDVRDVYKEMGISTSGDKDSSQSDSDDEDEDDEDEDEIEILSAPKKEGDAAKGKEVYLVQCIACHAPDPSVAGPVGPEIKGSSRELLEARVLNATYPEGHKAKRDTKMMPPLPHLIEEIDNIHIFLNQ